MAETLSHGWIDSLTSEGTLSTKQSYLASTLQDALHSTLNDLEDVLAEFSNDPADIALGLARKENPKALKEYDTKMGHLAKALAAVRDLQAESDELKDSIVAPYMEQANELVDEKSDDNDAAIKSARDRVTHLAKIATGGEIKPPKAPGDNSSKSKGTAWRPDLDSATVNGDAVVPADGQWPKFSDVHRAVTNIVTYHGTVSELSALARRMTGGKVKNCTLTINGTEVNIGLTARKDEDKPQRGRTAA